ncbi:hypothetical protein Taro_026757 [Colocasia esculenta]|uniref:Uncharacterized protein n=1 Tax=Colocasia esculenta TaxID=4460 RepID=A0A843VG46_COLES|nr:hypothetical protein [Colocasia esculenta]
MSRQLGALRHQKRRRPGQVRPYRDAVGGCNKGRCRDALSGRDRVTVATRCPVTTGWLSRCPSPSRWRRDGFRGRDSTCVASVAVALPSGLRCIAWLPCVLVRIPRTVFYCPIEGSSQDYSALIFVYCCATSGSEVCYWFGWCVLAGFPRMVPWWFWWRFSHDRIALLLLAAVFFLMVHAVWSFGLRSGEGSSLECPLSFLVEVLPKAASCCFGRRCSLSLCFRGPGCVSACAPG